MADFKIEFPDYPAADIPAAFLAAPWTDASWGNDSCPSFSRTLNGKREVHVYVDWAKPEDRDQWNGEGDAFDRFSVMVTDDEGSFTDDAAFNTNDLDAVLAHVESVAARALADKWVAKLGVGFHPDTRGADYDPPLSADEIAQYDADIDALFSAGGDPYGHAVDAMKAWEASR